MKTLNHAILSKYRGCLMGVATIMILVFHLSSTSDYATIGKVRILVGLCNSGVDIFVLLSGLGCYYSLNKDANIAGFYKRRLSNVLPISFFLMFVFCFFEFILGVKSLGKSIIDVFRIGSDNPAWYVPFSILLYVCYPLVHYISKGKRGGRNLIIASVIIALLTIIWNLADLNSFRKVEASLTRVPVFLLGCYLGKCSQQKKDIRFAWLCLPLFLLLMVTNSFFQQVGVGQVIYRYRGSCLGVFVSLLCAVVLEAIPENKVHSLFMSVLLFFGGMSLEAYLTHNLAKSLFGYKNLLTMRSYICIVLVSIAVSFFLSKARSRIGKKLNSMS